MTNESTGTKKALTPNQRDDRRIALQMALDHSKFTLDSVDADTVVENAEKFRAFLGGDQ